MACVFFFARKEVISLKEEKYGQHVKGASKTTPGFAVMDYE